MKIHHTFSTTILTAAITAALSPSLMAQQNQLEEIIITAQKRAESLQDVPVSVSALTSSDLEGLKLRDTTEIAAQIPNLQASSVAGDGMPIFSLRGVSMNDFSFNQNSPVAVYIDEVYKGNPALQGVQIYDLERIEVLRGPQGTLYGKNSTGGAINFITKRPTRETEAYLSGGIGDYSRRELEGAANFALSEELAVRIAGTWTRAAGWQKNKTPGVDDGSAIDEYAARLSVLWEPSDALSLLLRSAFGESRGVNYGIVADQIGPDGIGAGIYGLYNFLGATTRVDGTRNGLDTWEFESEQDLERMVENQSTSLTVNWDLNDTLTLTSISSYDDGENFVPEDADGTVNTLINARQGAKVEQYAQDIRLTSNFGGPINFIVGAYHSNEEVKAQTTLQYAQDLDFNLDGNLDYSDCSDPLFLFFGVPEAVSPAGLATDALFQAELGMSLGDLVGYGCQTQNDFKQERKSYAAYFDGSYALDDHWTLRLGLRYTHDETKLSDFSARYLGNDDTPILATIPLDDSNPYATLSNREFSDDEITGKFGIDYTTDRDTLIYASFSHGYRAGAFNAQAFQDVSEVTQVDPETLDAYEVGFKTKLLDGSLQLNAAAYFYTYENQQFLNIDENLIQTLVNIDESEISGLELELTTRPHDALLLRAGLGLLDAEVKTGVLSNQDLAGNALPQSPEVNFNVAIDWDAYQSDAGTVTVHLDGTYTDKQFFEVANVGHTEADGYWVANAMLTFESSNADWAVSLWVKNLIEEEYQTSILDLQGFFGFNYTHVGAPRTYGAELTLRF